MAAREFNTRVTECQYLGGTFLRSTQDGEASRGQLCRITELSSSNDVQIDD
jgi:hypothetical protein